MMQLVYSYVTAVRKDTTALNSFVSREKSRYMNLLANPQNWFFDKLSHITSGNNPRRGLPPMDSYDKIKMDEIIDRIITTMIHKLVDKLFRAYI